MAKKHSSRRRLKVVRLALIVGMLVVLCGAMYGLNRYQIRRQAGGFLDRARAAADREEWTEAAGMYQSYLQFQPRDADALAHYAEVLEHQAEINPTVVISLTAIYERLLGLESHRDEQRLKLVRHYLSQSYTSGARGHLNSLLADAGRRSDPELYDLLATCEERERKYPEAADALRKAVGTGKADPSIYTRLAIILRTHIKTPDAELEAETLLNELVSKNPTDLKARLARARFYSATGNTKRARDDAEFAFRNLVGGKTNPEAVILLADLAAAELDYTTAKDALQAGLLANPKDNRVRVALAEIQSRLNDTASAKKTLQEAALTADKPDIVLLEIADRLIDLGDFDTPATMADKFARDQKVSFIGWYLLGRLKLAEGNWPAALTLLEQAAAGGLTRVPPQYVKARLGIADCYALANNPDRRLEAYTQALAVDAKSVLAMLGRAECLAQTGRLKEATDAYQALAAAVPAARVALCRLRLADLLARPEADRNWALFDDACGPDPVSIDVALLKANALYARGRPDDGAKLFQEIGRKASDRPAVRATLALLAGGNDPAAGLLALDNAQRELGDRVDFRLARAGLLARSPDFDPASIAALGQSIGGFPKGERFRLLLGLGDQLAVLGRSTEAIDAFRRAAAEAPYDVVARGAIFDLALQTNDAPLQAAVLAELGKIEGADGPVKVTCETTRGIRDTKAGDASRINDLRAKARSIRGLRPTWGRTFLLLGDLDLLDANADGALENYRRAVELGERNANLIRNLVALLMDRQGQVEALEILSRVARSGPMPTDMAKQLATLRSAFGEDPARSLAWARSPDVVNAKDYRDQLVRAAVLAGNGATAEARTAVEKALGLNDSAAEAWVAMVRFLVAAGKPEEAKAAAAQAAKKVRPTADTPIEKAAVAVALGTCRELIGDSPGAETYYRDALSLHRPDLAANRNLFLLFQRTNRRPEAESLVAQLASADVPPSLKRWARRALAFSKVGHVDGFAEVNAALELIDLNLREGENLLDDQRAKALVLAADPFRQAEAVDLLTASAKTIPLTADQNFLLARLLAQQGRTDRAEAALMEATRAAGLAAPDHLGLLVKLQVARGATSAATTTLRTLKAVAPGTWEAAVAEARVLVAAEKRGDAAKLIRDAAGASDYATLVGRVGPTLEELGCKAEAEAVYRIAVESGKTPTAHAPLGSFLIRSGRFSDALDLAFKYEASAPVGTTARLLSGAGRANPPQLLPPDQRDAWTARLETVRDWITKKIAANANDPDLLFAKAECDDIFGKYDDEIAGYQRAIEATPENDVYRNNLAIIIALHRRDGGTTTLNEINRVIGRKGPRPTYLDTRAIVHTIGGRYDDAVRDLSAAITLDPKPVYYFHLAQVYDARGDEKTEYAKQRTENMREAVRRGLTKMMLHPKEWTDFDRLLATVAK